MDRHGFQVEAKRFYDEHFRLVHWFDGPIAIDAMRSIKKALDPKGILNPGKIFPA